VEKRLKTRTRITLLNIIRGIIGAKAIGKIPLKRAITLGKRAINNAPRTPIKITARKREAFTSGPATACDPEKGARNEIKNKEIK